MKKVQTKDPMKIVFIVWERYHRRSELLAQHLGAKIFYVAYGKKGKLLHAFIKYPLQTLKTWLILRRENPNVIFIQNPPIFCALAVYVYTCLFSSKYVIDSHTGAFVFPGWGRYLKLHRWVSQRAIATIIHNGDQEEIVKSWGCPYCVIGFTPEDYSIDEPYPIDGNFGIAVISDFNPEDPLGEIFKAAVSLPEVSF